MNASREAGLATRVRNNAAKRAAFIEEVEFLLSCDVGEAAILEAFGASNKPLAFQRRLYRAERPDLIHRVFEWQAECAELMRPDRYAA